MRIACVHQGYELYGSDRCFAESVAALRVAYPAAEIDVVLPRPGPLATYLGPTATRILFERLWILRRRDLKTLMTIGLLRLPAALMRAARRCRSYNLVYINTSVVTDHILAARIAPSRVLLHVHEIPEGLTLTILRSLVRWSHAQIIFNSHATEAAFALPTRARAQVIYNGITGPQAAEPSGYDGTRPLRLLLLGRINRIKGQEVLLEAMAALPDATRARIEVRMVGNAFESPDSEAALHALKDRLNLSSTVSIEPFAEDTAPLYRWADWVIVPSRRPESLGRVAIEAMAYARPVLASAIGGLKEVVLDGQTGWLIPPDRADALAERLQHIIGEPASWQGFAAAARQRYLELFSDQAAAQALATLVRAM